MAKIYDISSKLVEEAPQLKLDADHVYTIKTDKNTILKITEKQKSTSKGDADANEVFKLLLGEEATNEIDGILSSKENYQANQQVLLIACMAGAMNLPYEVMAKRFQQGIAKA